MASLQLEIALLASGRYVLQFAAEGLNVCGICGWVGMAAAPADAAAGPRMRETLVHRGPDGVGELEISAPERRIHGWLGHRRLKVIDVTESAHQPMLGAQGRVALTYNGEIYNFRELRRELAGRGHRFASSGDTEVVLRAYEEWGEEFV